MRKIIGYVMLIFVMMIAIAPNLPIELNSKTEAQNLDVLSVKTANMQLKNKKTKNKTVNNAKNAQDVDKDYYVVYDYNDVKKVVFVRGERAQEGDEYISADNKRYIICEIDDATKTAKAKYIEDVKLPVLNVKRNAEKYTSSEGKLPIKANAQNVVHAENKIKRVGLYHTHNDECYNDEDGTDSVYGKGGIHQIGKTLKNNLEKLNIIVDYSEDLHLPHNSGAYSRSEVTASNLLNNNKLDAIFDVHRDATPRKEYLTTVNGVTMSKVRMVVGAGNQNMEENKQFALSIKAYADEVYPGLIKDIYIGKGNYNQQLSPRSMLFEMGTNTIEKEYARRATLPLSKTIDAVLFGIDNAGSDTKEDVVVLDKTNTEAVSSVSQGLVETSKTSTASNNLLWILLGVFGGIALILGGVYLFVPKVRTKINRFFSELFPVRKPKNIKE